MTRSTKKKKRTQPATHYSIFRGKDGVDETFDIVCNITGRVIALLPFWYEDAETLRETRALIRALDRLHRRGGYFFMECFAKSNEAIVQKYYLPEIVGGGGEQAGS
jgi:hypothetical protein